MAIIADVGKLREIIGEPNELVPRKLHVELNAQSIAFIERSPLMFLATSDDKEQPTVSPKGDAPGFVRVENPRTLLMPERKGNKLIFSLQNILTNPAIGMIFVVPGSGETLRVMGNAELLDDADLCASFIQRDKPALLVIRVRVTQCYFHCAKSIIRSAVWEPASWPEHVKISFGEEIAQSGGLAPRDIEQFDAGVRERYKTDL